MIYEGKAKTLIKLENTTDLIMKFKDTMTALNGKKVITVSGKGILSKQISDFLFKKLENHRIDTHYVKNYDHNSLLVKKMKMIPLEVVLRRRVAGSFYKKMNYSLGYLFQEPLIEFYLKNDDLNDPQVTEDFVVKERILSKELLEEVKVKSLKILFLLNDVFKQVKLELIDIKLEFGLKSNIEDDDQVVLADELSPDNFRVWDCETLRALSIHKNKIDNFKIIKTLSLDKDLFRYDFYDDDPAVLFRAYSLVYKKLSDSLLL